MRDAVTNSSGLSEDEINLLRGLVVRRRTKEAEQWLVRRGFTADRAARIVLEQEMAVSNAIYAAPFWDVVFAIVPLLIALLLIGFAADAEHPGASEAFRFEGRRRTLALGAIVAPFLIASAFFAFRAVRGTMQYLKARMQYRTGNIQDRGL